MITRGFANIVTTDVATVKAWYVDLLGWEPEFESDWFIHLKAPEVPGLELAIILAGHDIVPEGLSPQSGGVMLTMAVDDVDATHNHAKRLGYNIIEEPRDLFYGQRRMVLKDPAGTVVDVSSVCEPSEAFLASLSGRP